MSFAAVAHELSRICCPGADKVDSGLRVDFLEFGTFGSNISPIEKEPRCARITSSLIKRIETVEKGASSWVCDDGSYGWRLYYRHPFNKPGDSTKTHIKTPAYQSNQYLNSVTTKGLRCGSTVSRRVRTSITYL